MDLYPELKADLQQLAGPLFQVSTIFIRKRGAFLPHGAVLNASNEVRLLMATPDDNPDKEVSTTEVLPLLHASLRKATLADVKAVGVCEDVRVAFEGQPETRAIKVLVEHQRGLCVAFYLPFARRMLWGWKFGEMIAKPASAEVKCWGASSAS